MTKEQSYANDAIKHYRTWLPQDKYDHPGVYKITVNNEIVYVGKARNMADRIATHIQMIRDAKLRTEGEKFKYGELREAIKNHYNIQFDVLYTSLLSNDTDNIYIDNDIGPYEAKYINEYMPKLNKQIPDLFNYHKYRNKPYEKLNINRSFEESTS